MTVMAGFSVNLGIFLIAWSDLFIYYCPFHFPVEKPNRLRILDRIQSVATTGNFTVGKLLGDLHGHRTMETMIPWQRISYSAANIGSGQMLGVSDEAFVHLVSGISEQLLLSGLPSSLSGWRRTHKISASTVVHTDTPSWRVPDGPNRRLPPPEKSLAVFSLDE